MASYGQKHDMETEQGKVCDTNECREPEPSPAQGAQDEAHLGLDF